MLQPASRLFSLLGRNIQGDIGPYTCYRNKQHRFVWFLKAPPKEPASVLQRVLRHRWKMAISTWLGLDPAVRANWELATKRLSLRLTGYNLWIWWYLKEDRAAIATIEHQSGLVLIDD